MRFLIALITTIALLPGCCLIGMAAGGSRAAAHNDEVARKLERGEYVGPEELEDQSVGKAELTGFAVGGLIDVAVATVAVSLAMSNFSLGPPTKPSEY